MPRDVAVTDLATRWRQLFGSAPPKGGAPGVPGRAAAGPAERILSALAKDARKALGPTLTSQDMVRLVGSLDVELAIAGASANGASLVVIAGASQGEGCTVTALGIALCAAARDPRRRVLLIDANDGSAARALGETGEEPHASGSVARDDGSDLLAYVVSPTAMTNLQLLARGHEGQNHHALRGPLERLLDEARGCFDLVIIDTPALADDPASLALARKAGNVLLVLRRANLPASAIAATVEEVRRVGATLLGCVLTDRRGRRVSSARR